MKRIRGKVHYGAGIAIAALGLLIVFEAGVLCTIGAISIVAFAVVLAIMIGVFILLVPEWKEGAKNE